MEIKKGIPVSPGVAICPAVVLDAEDVRVPRRTIPPAQFQHQHDRLEEAFASAKAEVEQLRDQVAVELGPEPAKIFGFHLGMLEDKSLTDQIHKLIELRDGATSCLFCTDKAPRFKRFSKRYYEPPDKALLNIIPSGVRILSYGAGSGELEEAVLSKSKSLKAVPIDPVVGAILQHRNIQVATMDNLGNESIWDIGTNTDCTLLPNVLQHVKDPVQVLRRIANSSDQQPFIAGIVPNFNRISKWLIKYQIKKIGYENSKLHPTTHSVLRSWASLSDLDIHVVHVIHKNFKWLSRFLRGTLDTFFSERIVFVMYSRKNTPKKLLSEIDLTKTRTYTDLESDENKLINFFQKHSENQQCMNSR